MIGIVDLNPILELQLDVHDIEDPDNAPSRLEDLMNGMY